MSDSIPKVSIVIPHWNNVEILSECLKSIGSTIYPDFEVIVVDNASTDNSVQYVKSNFPDVKLIENDRNDGYAGGCNIGADLAQGKYLVFLNNDNMALILSKEQQYMAKIFNIKLFFFKRWKF